ncbi:MAG TPA: Hsp70 family protein [Actinophytocola sp.]|jgi:actin-like ATPase involved in cell morphogenesis|nr:Hsp70 family protein [Actinophytocola sp.]
MYALGIDLGTTFTAAAVWRDGRAQIVSLGGRGAAIPSVVLLREDETFLTGEAANRRGLTEPSRVAREFKRRIGDTTPILLAGTPNSAESLTSHLLRAVVSEVVTREGGPPSSVCVSHPANWGPYKIDLLRQAVRMADLPAQVTFATEPEAAAVNYAQEQRLGVGAVVAVYDLGGGTFDAAVLRRTATGFAILGEPEGIERLGGIDFDAAVFNHVRTSLGTKLDDLDEDDPAVISAVARLREECVAAKEALSADTDTAIPVLLPSVTTEVRLTRGELESMVRPSLHGSIEALQRAVRSAALSATDLHSVLLVGGSSRMPIVGQLVSAELGRPVAVDTHPKHAVALGAAWLAGGSLGGVGGGVAPGTAAGGPGGPGSGGPGRGAAAVAGAAGGLAAAGLGAGLAAGQGGQGRPASAGGPANRGGTAGAAGQGVPGGRGGGPGQGQGGPGAGPGTAPGGHGAGQGETAAGAGFGAGPGGGSGGGSGGVAGYQDAGLGGARGAGPGTLPGGPGAGRGSAPVGQGGAQGAGSGGHPAGGTRPGAPGGGDATVAGPMAAARNAGLGTGTPPSGFPAGRGPGTPPGGFPADAGTAVRHGPGTPPGGTPRAGGPGQGPRGGGGAAGAPRTTPLGAEAPVKDPIGPPAEDGEKRRRVLVGASAVVALAVLAAVAVALNVFGGNDQPQAGSAGQTSSVPADSLPPDERCTPEIMANEHWVCLTSAIVADGKITIDYRSDGAFDLHGVHLHVYGGDGTDPQAGVMGQQVPDSEQGDWYNEAARPAVLELSDPRFKSAIGDAKKVCARIADAEHMLVPDKDGAYVTGNCVPITRTDSSTTEETEQQQDGGNDTPDNNDTPTTTDTTTWPTTTDTTTTETTEDTPSESAGP